MLCSSCKTDNPADAAFCEQCGAKLELVCPKCKTAVNPGARFCKKCGTAIGANAAPAAKKSADATIRLVETATTENVAGERKTVTALFADIKGSMDLMEDLDPEEARALVDPALKLMIDAVHRYDGYIVQSTGDGIFALFGAPVAHEDHPQRALYAALRIQDEMRRYSSRLREAGNPPIEARVGANTGEAVVRSIKTDDTHTEYTPIGHSTSLASRMQTLAPTGSIAVTEAMQKLCAGYFNFKALGPTRVKGVSEPINVFEVTGLGPLRTRLQRAVGRGLTKFVGREREIDAMKHAAEQARSGHGQIVVAIAEAGVGKSRLFFEFKAISQSSWMVLETFSVSHGKASAYLPLIELLCRYFNIGDEDDDRSRREKVAGRLAILDTSLEDTRPYIFALLGITETTEHHLLQWEQNLDRLDQYLHQLQNKDSLAQMDPQIQRRRTLDAIKRILVRESLNQPLIVILEDLHWIDDETQAFLNLMADSIGTARILLLVNYRPEYRHEWGHKTYYTQLRLDPLGKESADEMLTALLGNDAGLDALKRLIIERTEGNPFFMEETVQVLIDEGALVRNGATKLTRPLSELKIPTTVQAILTSRIDRLASAAKELLQTLAVLGKEFALPLVRRVNNRPVDEVDQLLGDLQLAEFIYEQPAFPDPEFVFKHALTQEVAYNSILIERRRALHESAAASIEALYADKLDDYLAELAHHYGRSGNTGKAVEYLGRSAQQAIQRSAYGDAISRLTSAIDLLQKLPESSDRFQQELPLQLALGPALIAARGFASPDVERAYTRAHKLCQRLGNPPELFPVMFGLWTSYTVRGELRRANEVAEPLIRLAQSANDSGPLLFAHFAVGDTSFWMGDFLPAKEHFEIAIALYDPVLHRPLADRYVGTDAGVWCLGHAALTLWHLGYQDQALKRVNEALALAKTLSHPYSLAFAEFFAGFLRQYRREVTLAKEHAENGIALCAGHGFSEYSAYATILGGWTITALGRHEEGIARIREGLAAFRATRAELFRPYLLALLADACMEMGRFDEGRNALTEAVAATDQHENRNYEAETHRLKGELLLKQDESNAAEARKCFEHGIEVSRKQHAKSWELRATMSLAQLLARQGRRDEARTMLAEIYHWFTEGFDTRDLIEAKALLDELAG